SPVTGPPALGGEVSQRPVLPRARRRAAHEASGRQNDQGPTARPMGRSGLACWPHSSPFTARPGPAWPGLAWPGLGELWLRHPGLSSATCRSPRRGHALRGTPARYCGRVLEGLSPELTPEEEK